MKIYIVEVESKADFSRRSFWIHAPNETAAAKKALQITGKEVSSVINVESLVRLVALEHPRPAKRRTGQKVVKQAKRKAAKIALRTKKKPK